MATITDEMRQERIEAAKNYTAVILKEGPNRNRADLKQIIWEHGRRNFDLRSQGLLSIVCPVTDDSEVLGLGIFNIAEELTKRIMDDDPGVKEGVFVYETHPVRSFPGDSLP